jgi:AcrR family transcriptional regulator
MARPPEPEKRLDLAQRAVAVLQREGLDVATSELADALGVNRSTLLYHFPTRDQMVETALVALLAEQARFVLARVEEHEHPIDRLYAQLRAVHAFHHGREDRIVFLTQAIAASGERMAEIVAAGNQVFEAHRRAAAERVRKGIEEGIVEPCDPEALVSCIRALVDGLMVQRMMTGLDLGPVHELVWERLLLPLKRDDRREKRKRAKS